VCLHGLQELRKASGQQLREVQVVQGEAVKQLRDERQQAERKKAQLKVNDTATELYPVSTDFQPLHVQSWVHCQIISFST